jgi:hypothetical protein
MKEQTNKQTNKMFMGVGEPKLSGLGAGLQGFSTNTD